MTTIYLTRHGETEWNLARRFQGQLDSPLTERGRLQAEWLQDRLKTIEFSAIYSSCSNRAFDTAKIVRGHRTMPIETRKELMEIMLGNWEGKSIPGIEVDEPEKFHHFWEAPHLYQTETGESFEEVMERSYKVLEEIRSNHTGNVLVVSHGIVLKSLLCRLGGKPLNELWDGAFMKQTSLTIVECDENGYKIVMEGDTSHHKVYE